MKQYNITVNGTVYDVTVEELGENEGTTAHATPARAPKAAAPVTAPAGEGVRLESPMPGTIIDINAKIGDNVKKGQTVAVLEAMKMENDIVSPVDGVVTSIAVAKGASVGTRALIATIKA